TFRTPATSLRPPVFFFYCHGAPRPLHSFPTRRSSDLSRERHADLFHAAIGGLGLLGCFTSLTLRTRRIYSGLVAEVQRPYGSLEVRRAHDSTPVTDQTLMAASAFKKKKRNCIRIIGPR